MRLSPGRRCACTKSPGRHEALFLAKERIWIGVDDGYPHRIVQRDGAFVSTGTYSKFNQTFSVAQ
jgi:hypothetical protein